MTGTYTLHIPVPEGFSPETDTVRIVGMRGSAYDFAGRTASRIRIEVDVDIQKTPPLVGVPVLVAGENGGGA